MAVGQALHTPCEAAPTTVEAFPGGHSAHVPWEVAPMAALHFPAGQGVEAPRLQNCPAGQGTIELLLEHTNPLGQAEHAEAPGWDTYPGVQARQDALEVAKTVGL